MGYPMTWRRVMNRNGLSEGDYTAPPPAGKAAFKPVYLREGLTIDVAVSVLDALCASIAKREEEAERRWRCLAGDMRRLERDAKDERATCERIAERTGIDAETVAAVLKEFIEW